MIKIEDFNILDLLPSSLKENEDIKAAAKAVDKDFVKVVEESKGIIIIPNIDKVSEDVLDHLAYFFHVDFYDIDLDVEIKRKLIKDSVYTHQIKGSAYAVEKLVTTLFGSGEVEEWFDYGGDPYTFQVLVDISALKDGPGKFYRAIDTVKNTRSHLDMFIGRVADIVFILNLKTYTFPVPYKICNMFHTADVQGGLAKSSIELAEKTYSFDVKYPITNTFVATGNKISDNNFNIELSSEYRNNEVLFKRISKFNIGEGDI